MLKRTVPLIGSCLAGLLLLGLFSSLFLQPSDVVAADHFYVDAVAGSNDTTLHSNGTDYVVHFPSTSFYTETTSIRGFKIMNGDNGI